VGILLCAKKNAEMVKLALPENNSTILPSENQLLAELRKEIDEVMERGLRYE
jgi:hypothetical protein